MLAQEQNCTAMIQGNAGDTIDSIATSIDNRKKTDQNAVANAVRTSDSILRQNNFTRYLRLTSSAGSAAAPGPPIGDGGRGRTGIFV